MIFPSVNYTSRESILESFDSIAEKISNEIQLKINDAYYRIIDFEFYSFSDRLPDPHTYKNQLQLQSYKLYLHGSGLDITFGDGINHLGILLRSIVKLYDGSTNESGFMTVQTDGPQKVATELLSNLYCLDAMEKNEIEILNIDRYHQDSSFFPSIEYLKTKRVGLTSKPLDKEGFYKNLKLRYIVILQQFPKFKQKLKGVETILAESVASGEMTEDKAREKSKTILDYYKNF